jgi:hypothetical protein
MFADNTLTHPKKRRGALHMSPAIRSLTIGATLIAIGITLIRGRRQRVKRAAFRR